MGDATALFSASHFTFSIHALPPLLTAVAILALGVFVTVREKGSLVSLLYLLYTLTVTTWMLFVAIALFMTSEAVAFRWMTIANAGVTMIPAALYQFTIAVIRVDRFHRRLAWYSWLISSIFLVLTLGSDVLFDGFYHYSWGFFLRFRWPSYLFMAHFFVMTLTTLRLYWVEYRRSDQGSTRHQRAKAFLVALSIGYLGALDFLPAIGVPYYPLSSVPMTCMLILVARAIWQYRLVDITPAFAAREIIDTMSDGLIVLDRDGVVRLVNRATCLLLGCSEEELVGRRPADSLAGSPELARELASTAAAGPVEDREVSVRSQDGRERVLSLSASVMLDQTGRRAAAVCLMSDITGRRRAERERERLISELREANEKLQTIDQMKTNFVTMASHELRTPLTTIKAFVELLIMKQTMPEVQRLRLMTTINAETDRLSRLIGDLLDLARIEAGTMKWQDDEIAFEDLIVSVVTGMALLFENKGLRVATDFTRPLPPFRGDRDRMVQVLTNLLSNAVKFTPAGGAVSVIARHEPGPPERLVLEVSDTGIGIAPEDLEPIFEKFHRSGSNASAAVEGTGLGLAITRQIVAHYNGTIRATSTPGSGSLFTISLPLAR